MNPYATLGGGRQPTVTTARLAALAQALGVPMETLVRRDG